MKRNLLRLGAIHLSVFALLMLAAAIGLEAYLRLTIPPSSSKSIYEYTLATPRYKVMKANAAVQAWGHELRTNNLGFRDRAAEIAPKQPGEFRIIVLGASFTVSAGVDFDAIYSSVVQKRLREAFPRVKVINLAVGGYNIIQYALVLQEVGLALDPDLVLVAICPEDDFGLGIYEANYRVASGQASPVPELAWYEKTYVYRAYGARLESKIRRLLEEPDPDATRRARAAWEQNSAALESITALAAARDIPVRAVLLPLTWNLERQRDRFGRVENLCRRLGLECLSLLEPFIASGIAESSLRLNAIDGHPNERYNAMVAGPLAADLARFLSARGGLVLTDSAGSMR